MNINLEEHQVGKLTPLELAEAYTFSDLLHALKHSYTRGLGLGSPFQEVVERKLEDHARLRTLSIAELDFSQRTYNCLRRVGAYNLLDLSYCSTEDLQNIRGFGVKSLQEVVERIGKYGITLSSRSISRFDGVEGALCSFVRDQVSEEGLKALVYNQYERFSRKVFYGVDELYAYQYLHYPSYYCDAVVLLEGKGVAESVSYLRSQGFLPPWEI